MFYFLFFHINKKIEILCFLIYILHFNLRHQYLNMDQLTPEQLYCLANQALLQLRRYDYDFAQQNMRRNLVFNLLNTARNLQDELFTRRNAVANHPPPPLHI